LGDAYHLGPRRGPRRSTRRRRSVASQGGSGPGAGCYVAPVSTGARRWAIGVRTGVGVGAILLVLLLAGVGVAQGLSSFLGVRTEAKSVPVEHLTAAPAEAVVPPPSLGSVSIVHTERTDLAVAELRSAIAAAPSRSADSLLLTVHYGSAGGDIDTYTVTTLPSPFGRVALSVTAPSVTGAVRAVYDLAAQVRAGRSIFEHVNTTVTSKLPFRMVDLGAAGVTPDPGQWNSSTNYTLNDGYFADVVTAAAPYIDQAALTRARADIDAYAAHVLALGYNAITIPGFLEYLTFEAVPGVYAAGDPHVARAKAMQAAFGPIFAHLADLGLKVYLGTDMVALDSPLKAYLDTRFGGLATTNPDFWGVYRAGLAELYRAMPSLSGVLVRIGEGGSAYSRPGWDYYSDLAVTSVPSVRDMLTALLATSDAADKDLVFRTWSVGIGGVGDLHTDPAAYHAVLDGIDSPHLVVSTKFVLGDFYSYLPFNETLTIGTQRRIIELQSRREFEDYGSLPDDLGSLYQQAIQQLTAANPHIEGIWTWTQEGGPWRAGPMTLELKTGFWQLYELNTIQAVRLARDPATDPAEVTADWAREYLSDDPGTVAAIGRMMALSRDAILHGLYIGPYAATRAFALGLQPPPMMWIFEWDIVSGDSATLDTIYSITRDAGKLDAAIAEGHQAVTIAEQMRSTIAAAPADTWKDAQLHTDLVNTLDYEVQTLQMFDAYRAMILHHAAWADTGDGRQYAEYRTAATQFDDLAAQHETRYAHDLDQSAYLLTAARLGMVRADRDRPMAWLAAGLLGLLGVWFVVGLLGRRLGRVGRVARAHWLSALMPWRAAELTVGLGRRGLALLAAVPLGFLVASRLVQTWFAAPSQWFITGLAWVVFLGVVVGFAWRRHLLGAVGAAVGGAVLLRVALLLVALTGQGPAGYWFAFWADPGARGGYVVVAFVLFAWVLVAAAWALRMPSAAVGAAGAALVMGGVVVGAIGLERAMTVWNDQMNLLPYGLSRILGITVYLGIPADLPWWVAGLGGILVVGAVLGSLVVPRASRLARAVLLRVG